MTGAVVPRPIAWVSTISAEKILNLAPFSFFTVASKSPPMLCISIGPGIGERIGTVKDTLENIIDTEEFVINIVSRDLANQMHQSSGNYTEETNEFEIVGVTPMDSQLISAPRVKEAPINMECKLEKIIQLGSDHLVIGQLVLYHIQNEFYLEKYKVNHELLQPVARLAGNYSWIEKTFKMTNKKL